MLLCTTAFEQLAKIQCAARGLPDLPRIVVPHPIGGMPPTAAVDKAREAWPRLEQWLRRVTVSQAG